MHSRAVSRIGWLAAFGFVVAGCGGAAGPVAPRVAVLPVAAPAAAAAPVALPEHWYFEWLSQDGQRALLRRLDGPARGMLQTRIVDVDSGATLAEDTFPELGRLPTATIGRRPTEMAELVGMLAAPAFGDDLVRGARLAGDFPFGSCGRLSASPGGGAIAFNAGDWLYVADKSGHVQRRLTSEAAYDPRFTPDGKHLLFRRATGSLDKVRAKYELFVVPADGSAPPRLLAGTAGARDRFAIDADGKAAVAIASQEPHIKTCVLSIALKPPFAVKRMACLDGGEQFVESALSPSGRWAAVTTQSTRDGALAWRLRVVSLATSKVVLDEPATPCMIVRAVSDAGLLVQSGARGIVLDDVPNQTRRTFGEGVELGHRGFFRGPSELVVVRGSSVGVVDLTKN
ncbi:hypothetical protein BH11MYX4_BH11MYX4_16620 [soil metagenome]